MNDNELYNNLHNCFDGPGSKHYTSKKRPELKDNVVRWN